MQLTGSFFGSEKTAGNTTVLQFGGITLDSVRQARLPEEKLLKLRAMLNDFHARRSICPRRDCQSFSKFKLSRGCPWWSFSSSHDRSHQMRDNPSSAYSSVERRCFLGNFKGRSFFFNDVLETSQTLELYTDTAASTGFEAVLVAITFMLLGRSTGNLTASSCWSFYPLTLSFTFGGHLWKTNMSYCSLTIPLLLRLLHTRLQNTRLSCGVQGSSVELL